MGPQSIDQQELNALDELNSLEDWSGSAKDFWPRYAAAVGRLLPASSIALLFRERKEGAKWKRFQEWSRDLRSKQPSSPGFNRQLLQQAEATVKDGQAILVLPSDSTSASGITGSLLSTMLLKQDDRRETLITAIVDAAPGTEASSLKTLKLSAEVVARYHRKVSEQQKAGDADRFELALELAGAASETRNFVKAAMEICNLVATRFQCDRVSLGWLKNGSIRLEAVSHSESFNRRMEEAQGIESAMEEAIDQDETIAWPQEDDDRAIAKAHEGLAKESGHCLSVPIHSEEVSIAALCCERAEPPFSLLEKTQLELAAQLLASRLRDLKQRDQWLGARAWNRLKESAAHWIGPERTGLKLAGLTLAGLLAALVFIKVPYRVEADFTLQSDEVAYLTAPYDGYIEEAPARPGQELEAETVLLKLDTSELQLEESAAVADVNRYRREADKARATGALADMRVNVALAEQAEARLALTQHRLSQAELKAPFPAIVVEGDLQDRLGAPVKQGESLIRVARIDKLHIEAQASERDIHELLESSAGEIAFASEPKLKFPVSIATLVPAAVASEAGNVFNLRCELVDPPEDWFRPGMTGLCKLEAGKRSLYWIFTHETTDFLRMLLWW